jgi:hypothetical protein
MELTLVGGTIVVPHFRAYEFGSLEEEVQNNIFLQIKPPAFGRQLQFS